jgi:uncharacterized protein YkwD
MRVMSLLLLVACARTPSSPARVATGTTMPFELSRATITFDPEAAIEREALAVVNRYRALAGVAAIGVDASLGAGCVEHADYLWQNRGRHEVAGLRAHDQVASLPGATPAGARCGKAAVIHFAARSTSAAIDAWMGTLYHRAPIVSPYVDRIGIGAAGAERKAVAMTFAIRRVQHAWPVAFPADGQRDVPTDFVPEVPDPIPGDGAAGYPFTLQFPTDEPVVDVTATLVDGDGNAVAFYLSSPERPASAGHAQRGLVGVIPQHPLRAGSRYTVSVAATWRGHRGVWSSTFTTK